MIFKYRKKENKQGGVLELKGSIDLDGDIEVLRGNNTFFRLVKNGTEFNPLRKHLPIAKFFPCAIWMHVC